jgi:hypothetical protein
MSLSKNKRTENIELALRHMMGELGDNAINELFLEIDKPPYENIYPTTWQHLEDRYLIERRDTMGAIYCRLTGYGWLEGLRITGTLESLEMKERVGQVMAELKTHVDGRQERELEYMDAIVAGAGVSYGFIYNIIESGYIERVLGRKGATWHYDAPGRLIVIPVDFGMELL